MICGASKDFTRQSADFIRLQGQGTVRVSKRLQSLTQEATLPANQHDVLRPDSTAFQIGLLPANGVQFRLRQITMQRMHLRRIRAGFANGLSLAKGHKGHAFKLRNNLARGVRHRAVGHNHALLTVSDTHQRKGLRGQGAVEPHHAAASGHKTVSAAQGKACGNVHHGRMPAEGIEIRPIGLRQAQLCQQGIAVLRSPERLAALPPPADHERRIFRRILLRHFAQAFARCSQIQRRRAGSPAAHKAAGGHAPRACGLSCSGNPANIVGGRLKMVQFHGIALLLRQQHHAASWAAGYWLAPAQVVQAQGGGSADPSKTIQQAHAHQQGGALKPVLRRRPEIRPVHGKGKGLSGRRHNRLGKKMRCKTRPRCCGDERSCGQMHPVDGPFCGPREACPGKISAGGCLRRFQRG